jgi:hypothetical protein
MTYIEQRNERIAEAEGVRNFVYLDHRNIPTTSRGVALLVEQQGNAWALRADFAAVATQMGYTAAQQNTLRTYLTALAREGTQAGGALPARTDIFRETALRDAGMIVYERGSGTNIERVRQDGLVILQQGQVANAELGRIMTAAEELATFNHVADSSETTMRALFAEGQFGTATLWNDFTQTSPTQAAVLFEVYFGAIADFSGLRFGRPHASSHPTVRKPLD